jgi:hypothetical protein
LASHIKFNAAVNEPEAGSRDRSREKISTRGGIDGFNRSNFEGKDVQRLQRSVQAGKYAVSGLRRRATGNPAVVRGRMGLKKTAGALL